MNTDPSFSFDLHPSLDAELDAAFERHTTINADPEDVAAKGLVQAVSQVIESNRSPLEADTISEIFKAEAEAAYTETVELFSNHAAVPGLDAEEFKNKNWQRLEKAYTAMVDADMEPEIIFTPGAKPAKRLPIDFWENIFSKLHGTRNKGLMLSGTIKKFWDTSRINPPGFDWSVCIIPGTTAPTLNYVPHDYDIKMLAEELDPRVADVLEVSSLSKAEDIYPDIATYLTLQARKLKSMTYPVDGITYTWLKGEVETSDGSWEAPLGDWATSDHAVTIHADYLGTTNGCIRPVVRG